MLPSDGSRVRVFPFRDVTIRSASFFPVAAPLSFPSVDITVTRSVPERTAMRVEPFCQALSVRVMV